MLILLPMASKTDLCRKNEVLHFLDTSVLRHLLCATTKAREHYKSKLGPKRYICKYIQMEFIRAFVIILVEYYSILAMPTIYHINDANILWSNKFQSRKLSGILLFAQSLFGSRKIDFSSSDDKPRALRLLADYIRRLVAKLHIDYIDTGIDPTRCARPTTFDSYDPLDTDGSLHEFWVAFNDKKKAKKHCAINHCLLQVHKTDVNTILQEKAPSSESDRRGYEKIVNTLAELVEAPNKLSCNYCARIGDAVISLLCPSNMRLEHTDYSFDYLMAVLNKEHFRHPSELSLYK